MPRRLVRYLKRGIADEKLNEGALGNDILSANEDGTDVLFADVGDYRNICMVIN